MEISREAILDKTHYGLKIYAYVLRQYYPNQTVLSVKGRDCGITRNPFNGGKETLRIHIDGIIATHRDTELEAFKGDVFDFAQYHFRITDEEEGVEQLEEKLLQFVNTGALKSNDAIVTNSRHYDALLKAQKEINNVQKGMNMGLTGDLLAIDIREALYHFGSISGEVSPDDLLGNIFANFCIGK